VERTVQFQDYYKTLGVERSASADEIKRAYRKLAMKHHPDRAGEGEREAAEALFKRINEAYEVLSDPEKRAKYDRFGERWRQGQEFTPPGREDGGRRMSREEMEEMFGSFGFSDFFAQMFGDDLRQQYAGGARRHTRYRHRGADVRAELVLSATQAVHGGTSAFEIPAAAACAQCGGVGFVEEHVCPTCGGVGSVRRARKVELKIPEDVRDGQVLRLRGLGEAGFEGGASGDLLLSLRIASDGAYRVAGDDLETDVEVAPWDAFVGTRAEVRTPQGTAHVTVPPESRSGAKLRLRGQGLADGRGGRGDLIAVVRHALPARLTARQQELLRELAGSDAEAKA
jgi:curved DNA-binding protein